MYAFYLCALSVQGLLLASEPGGGGVQGPLETTNNMKPGEPLSPEEASFTHASCTTARTVKGLCEGHTEFKGKPRLCTNVGFVSEDNTSFLENEPLFAMDNFWLRKQNTLLLTIRDQCKRIMYNYTTLEMQPPLFSWESNCVANDKFRGPLPVLLTQPDFYDYYLKALRYDGSITGEELTPLPIPGDTALRSWGLGHFAKMEKADLQCSKVSAAMHIPYLLNVTGLKMNELDGFIEFGAGAGTFARTFRALDFDGQHVTFDILPALLAQAMWYERRGLKACQWFDGKTCPTVSGQVWQTKDLQELQNAIQALPGPNNVFMAVNSLNECPVTWRTRVLRFIKRFEKVKYIMLVFPPAAGGGQQVDNWFFFSEFAKQAPKFQWCSYDDTQPDWLYHLIGKPHDGKPCPGRSVLVK